jgi:anti-sigma-K factor RskA
MSDLHSLTGAYAAGALDETEHSAFAAHLAACSPCSVEVRELLETTALLGIAAAEPAPPALRAAVMDEIARTRQLSPVVVSLADHAQRRRPFRRAGLTAAACLAVFSIGLGGYAWQLQHENSNLRHNTEQVNALASAPDARTVSRPIGAGTAQLIMSASRDQMEFVVSGLATPPNGRTYQIWLIGPNNTTRSAGTFTPEAARAQSKMLAGPGDATTLAVTEEPHGGSAQPSSKPFLVMPLTSA